MFYGRWGLADLGGIVRETTQDTFNQFFLADGKLQMDSLDAESVVQGRHLLQVMRREREREREGENNPSCSVRALWL